MPLRKESCLITEYIIEFPFHPPILYGLFIGSLAVEEFQFEGADPWLIWDSNHMNVTIGNVEQILTIDNWSQVNDDINSLTDIEVWLEME